MVVNVYASSRVARRMPLELFDNVVRYIDSRSDLITLAQTCVSLHALIIPKHIDYHVIRAPLSCSELWQHLISHPRLAGNVHTLVLYDGIPASSWRIPFTIEENDECPVTQPSPELFVAALKVMVNVKTLKLEAVCPGGNPTFRLALTVLRSVTTQLVSLSDLKISIASSLSAASLTEPSSEVRSFAQQYSVEHPQKWDIGGLVKMDLEVHEHIYSDASIFLGPMLSASVNLQELKISTVPAALAPTFCSARLPRLRHLYITRQHHMSPAVEELFVGFLRSHPTIETLQLTMLTPNRWETAIPPPYPLLPNIRHLLDAPSGLILPIFAGRVDRSLMLSTLGDFHMLAAASTTAFCTIHGHNLRKLGLTYMINLSTLRLAASIFPALEELTLPRQGDPMIAMRPAVHEPPARWPDWYMRLYSADDVVPQFPRLTVVTNVRAGTGFIPLYRDWLRAGSPDCTLSDHVDREIVEQALHGLHEKFPRLQMVNGWRL